MNLLIRSAHSKHGLKLAPTNPAIPRKTNNVLRSLGPKKGSGMRRHNLRLTLVKTAAYTGSCEQTCM